MAIIAGLRPGIRSQVSARKPEMVHNIRRFGLEAEASEDLAVDMLTLAAFRRLEEKVDKLHVGEVKSASTPPFTDFAPQQPQPYQTWNTGRGQTWRARSTGRGGNWQRFQAPAYPEPTYSSNTQFRGR